MGMTIGEKILARVCNKKLVKPGEIITAKVDLCMTNDATTHISIEIFEKQLNNKRVFDPSRVIFIIDHNVPSESTKTAEVQLKMRDFARKQGVHFYEGAGVCHQIMLEDFVEPGQLVVAADSHTCSYGGIGAFGIGVGSTDFTAIMSSGEMWIMVPRTIKIVLDGELKSNVYARDLILRIIGDLGANGANYKIIEFSGSAVEKLTIDDRVVLCNMAVEAGAKTALFEVDRKTIEFVREKGREVRHLLESDEDAQYENIYYYDLADIEPMVSKPHLVDDSDLVANHEGIKVDKCFIGSCNNGRIEALRVAAKILQGKKVNSSVSLMISPASKGVYLDAIKEGLIDIFIECGALVVNPNCSMCWGGCQGVIGEDEVLISTGTRNFKGRAGHANSYIYLASVATVATSAITGRITDPRGNV